MAAPDSTLIDQQNDADIPTPATPTAPKANAEKFRGVHRRITDWAKKAIVDAMPLRRLVDGKGSVDESDAVFHTGPFIAGAAQDDGSGAKLQTPSLSAKDAAVRQMNGLVLNREIVVLPIGNPSDSTYRYLKVAQLQASSAGLRDILSMELIMGSWDSQPKGTIQVTFGNKNGLAGPYRQYNNLFGCGLVAYTNAGVVTIYVKYPNNFRSGSLSITHNVQAIVFSDTWVEEVPPNTLPVFDSTNPTLFPPTLSVDETTLAVRGFVRTGPGNLGFKLKNVVAQPNSALNTGYYLELELDNGTTAKLALLI